MEEWRTQRLGDICEIVKGRKPTLKGRPSTGDLPYLVAKVIRGMQEPEFASVHDRNSVQVSKDETIIICDGSNSGEIFTGFSGILSSTMGKLRKKGDIDDGYLRAFLDSTFEVFNGSKTGAAIPHLDKEALYALTFSYPPLPEQRRIVAILDEALEAIAMAKENSEKNLQNAREVFESHLAAVFSARNEGWVDRRLASLCHRITVGHVGSMAKLYKPTGIPFLRSQNIRPFSVSMQNLVFIDEQFHASLAKSSLQAGDVAIVRTGYPGTAAVIPHSLGAANCSDLVIVRPGPEIDAHFLCAFFNSAFGKAMVSGKVVGAAQKHFNVGAAKDVVLHLPPLAEQEAIVAAADELRDQTDRLEDVHTRKLAALDELKKSLLHQAFTGQLTVKATDKQLETVA